MAQEILQLSGKITTPRIYNGISTFSYGEICMDQNNLRAADFERSLIEPEYNLKVFPEFVTNQNNCIECEWKFSEKIAILERELADEYEIRNKQMNIITEHEKNTQERLKEKDKEIENLKKENNRLEIKCADFKDQLEITTKHLDNLEETFNDVHKKYEKSKQTIQILQKNVEILKDNMIEHENCVNLKHKQFLQLKEHAIERMNYANSQLDLMNRKFSLESSKLRATVNELQIQTKTLSEQLQKTNQEKSELMGICDGLINSIHFPENNLLKNINVTNRNN